MTVEPRVILLGRVALAVARCDSDRLDDALEACASHESARRDLVDALLQGIPYSGFPGAINALGRWASRAGAGASLEPVPTSAGTGSREAGIRIFREVYGEQSDRVLAELRGYAPDLERWILEFAYGSVMVSGPPLVDIEALGIASLLGQGRRRPLHSHLRGASRLGWSREDLREYVQALRPGADPIVCDHAIEVIDRLK